MASLQFSTCKMMLINDTINSTIYFVMYSGLNVSGVKETVEVSKRHYSVRKCNYSENQFERFLQPACFIKLTEGKTYCR